MFVFAKRGCSWVEIKLKNIWDDGYLSQRRQIFNTRVLVISFFQKQNWPFYILRRHPKGRHQQKKNIFFRALSESPNPLPLTPIRATWSFFFFGSQNSRFESQFRTKNTIYTIKYTVYMQPKNS